MWGHIFDLKNPLIGSDNTWMLWTVCIVGASASIYLEQRYKWASKMTGAVIALIFAVILSNTGIIPMKSEVWNSVWNYVAPLSIPMLMMKCDIRKIIRDSNRLLVIFLIGSVGTACGAILGYALLQNYIPELAKLSGVFTSTYIGGAVNFTAVSKALGVSNEMISAATVADNMMMVLCVLILMLIPSMNFFLQKFSHPLIDDLEAEKLVQQNNQPKFVAAYAEAKEISLTDIALTVAIAFVTVSISSFLGDLFSNIIPSYNSILNIINTLLGNEYVWISTISIIGVTFKPKFFGSIRGSEEIGTFLIYIFFFVIGIPASVPLILQNPMVLLYAAIVAATNMLFCFTAGKFMHYDLETIILASNANIGGPTTAAAMAVTKGWKSLVGPSILVGTIGYVLGTYMGLIIGGLVEL